MDNQQIGVPAQGPIYQEQEPKSAKWLWLLVILLIIGGLVFAYVRGIGPFKQISFLKKVESPTPSATSMTETSPSPEASSAAVNKSSAKLRVLNGSGKAGGAASLKDYLESKGYTVSSIGNADSTDFKQTELKFKDSFKNFESTLTTDLSSKYSVTTNSTPLEASDSADIQVTLGAQ